MAMTNSRGEIGSLARYSRKYVSILQCPQFSGFQNNMADREKKNPYVCPNFCTPY
jgi:hypothetical protein